MWAGGEKKEENHLLGMLSYPPKTAKGQWRVSDLSGWVSCWGVGGGVVTRMNPASGRVEDLWIRLLAR